MKKQILVLTGLLLLSLIRPARAAETAANFFSYTPVSGRVIFLAVLASDDVLEPADCGLWVTDGTEEGTEELAELCGETDTAQGVRIRILATNGSVALFTDQLSRLWRTDGTAGGTFRLGNVTVTGENQALVGPDGRTFFFAGCNRPFGCEPWKSDGTREGTAMIRDLRPGRRSSALDLFTRDRGRVLFASGRSLWATNGTAAGTVELARVPQGSIERILPHGQQVFFTVFTGNAEVWATGPKPASPRLVQSLLGAHWRYSGLWMEEAGGRVFITRYDDVSVTTTLWETNGTSGGTRLLAEFEGNLSRFFTLSGNRVVFAASREEGKRPQLWYLDPGMKSPRRLAGTRLEPRLIQLGNHLFFIGAGPENRAWLWTTDGTRGGTRPVQSLCAGTCEPSIIFLLQTALGHLFFTDKESRLWTTDESGEAPVLLAQLPPGRYDVFGLIDLAPLGSGRIVFSGFDETNGVRPWVSDLTPGGTTPLLHGL